ncbi:MAG: hypothetical protein K2Y37_27360 [Pirellulales bacterium]|nr:hypothetical protein [Pirellulales bacterium]
MAASLTVTLTSDQRDLLLRLLDVALAETRVEAHRTHFSPDYRKQVLQEEEQIKALLGQLRSATG